MARFGQQEYLADLVDFARMRIRFPGLGGASTVAETARRFVEAFLQPFERLLETEHRSVGERPVRQSRIAVEVLRGYLARLGVDAADADAGYTRSAYRTLLTNLGTSYDELRIVRVGGPAEVEQAREALAGRLGLDRVERLDALFLAPPDTIEDRLERLFGLASTTRDVFGAQPGQPLVLTWRLDRLRRSWQQPSTADANRSVALIDPDLLDQDMVLDPAQGLPAAGMESELIDPAARLAAPRLWRERADEIAGIVAEVQAEIVAATAALPSALATFERVMTRFLGEVNPATALAARAESAADPQHEQNEPLIALDLAALRRLVRLRTLAASGTITDDEWADLVGILVRVRKHDRYPAWRDQEQQAGVFLSPDFFSLPPRRGERALPPWRATRLERLRWEDALRARTEQIRTAIDAMRAVVEATEQTALVGLRDALIAALADSLGGRDESLLAEQLTRRLQIDFKIGDGHPTTRLEQCVQTIHGLFFALRMGSPLGTDLPDGNPLAGWRLTVGDGPGELSEVQFDQEWHWMGTFATRRAVEYVKDNPDSYLLPSLRDRNRDQLFRPTAAFWQLMDSVRARPRLSREQARQLANTGIGDPGPDNPDTGYLWNLRAGLRTAENDAALPSDLDDYQLTEVRAPDDPDLRALIRKLFDGLANTRRSYDPGTGSIEIEDPHLAPHWFQEIFYFVPLAIALELHRSGEYLAALDWFETVYSYRLAEDQRKVYHGLELESVFSDRSRITPGIWLREELNPHYFARERRHAYTRFTITAIVQCLLDFADAEFTQATDESLPRARTLYLTALDALDVPEMAGDSQTIGTVRSHVALNLEKLRSGRNIAGMERPPSPVQDPASAVAPTIGAGGALVFGPAVAVRPTPYRYRTLVARAKELVGLAQQMEASYLSALEKRDAETYNLLRARQDLELSRTTVELQDLRVGEAELAVGQAELQQQRVAIQGETYQEWIDAGLNRWEQSMIDSFEQGGTARTLSAYAGMAGQIAQAATTAATASAPGVGAAAAGAFAVAMAAQGQFAATASAIEAETRGQVASVQATQERRRAEWQLQKNLADKDLEIAAEQIASAQRHQDIVKQEQAIAQLQSEQASAAVDFLANKFTNAELYEWMSRVLVRIYGYFLQQATAMSQLAQNQLAFERQETPPAFIQGDYWQPPAGAEAAAGTDSAPPDRRGLTGSARLLQDLYRLDQYAFETDERKLQLSQTMSLAGLFPFEFEQFRQTGVLPFGTPMELFDRAFPGHYLRLIKRVRTSVVALIPPTQGVRATLTASGLSRVVAGGNFQTTEVRRSPELVAFTSPVNATGVFELDAAGEMRLPFETMGVDTQWELRMPKAANQFDFRTIADVLLTIEYTALDSFDYRRQVIERLDLGVSAEHSYSVREDFPDAWYDLHNPEQPQMPLAIRFPTRRADFPPNLEDLRIANLLLYFARQDRSSDEIEVIQLRLTGPDHAEPAGAGATSIDGVISTRRGNGASWLPLVGSSPVGGWEILLPAAVLPRFVRGEISDVLFVLSYAARLPDWPR